jgi:hypothetical protein
MKYANRIGYSDINPYEVVKVISDKTIEVREMDAKLAEGEKPQFIVGGFAGHCVNQRELKYDISSNDSNPVVRIRLRKNGYFYSNNGERFKLADEPEKFYDYNF